ncbi:hypothetical protein KCP76_05880 [Salmonella enterica subsp. enterica serovar Weltevreden]|nr:hypothetical protein KCP76_05880 [Salmonella enterica subsp. enterica serovar Weltevreden]
MIEDEHDMLLAITRAGRMLMFPVVTSAVLSKGKRNKTATIPSAEAAKGDDAWTGAPVRALPPQSNS